MRTRPHLVSHSFVLSGRIWTGPPSPSLSPPPPWASILGPLIFLMWSSGWWFRGGLAIWPLPGGGGVNQQWPGHPKGNGQVGPSGNMVTKMSVRAPCPKALQDPAQHCSVVQGAAMTWNADSSGGRGGGSFAGAGQCPPTGCHPPPTALQPFCNHPHPFAGRQQPLHHRAPSAALVPAGPMDAQTPTARELSAPRVRVGRGPGVGVHADAGRGSGVGTPGGPSLLCAAVQGRLGEVKAALVPLGDAADRKEQHLQELQARTAALRAARPQSAAELAALLADADPVRLRFRGRIMDWAGTECPMGRLRTCRGGLERIKGGCGGGGGGSGGQWHVRGLRHMRQARRRSFCGAPSRPQRSFSVGAFWNAGCWPALAFLQFHETASAFAQCSGRMCQLFAILDPGVRGCRKGGCLNESVSFSFRLASGYTSFSSIRQTRFVLWGSV